MWLLACPTRGKWTYWKGIEIGLVYYISLDITALTFLNAGVLLQWSLVYKADHKNFYLELKSKTEISPEIMPPPVF